MRRKSACTSWARVSPDRKKCLLAVLGFLKRLSKQRPCQKSRKPSFRSSHFNKWFFELERIFPFSAKVHTLFSAIVIWGIYFLATFTQIVTQKDIKREKCWYEESTPPPHETPIRRPGSKSFNVCSRFFCFSSKVQPFSARWFPVFDFVAKTAHHVGVNYTEHIS